MTSYPPYLCPTCDEMHDYLTEVCPNTDQATQDEVEANSDGEQDYDWGDEGVQQDFGSETEDLDYNYSDDIDVQDFSDDELGDVETSFSTIDLDSEEDEDLDFVEEEQKRRMSDEEVGCMEVEPKRQKMQ